MNAPTFSRSLGFFSLGLGVAELLAPRKVAAFAGIHDDHDTLIRSLGAREIASGLAILNGTRTKEAVWSRVLGDAIDLGLLAAALNSPRTDRRRLTGALVMVGAVTALDVFTSARLQRGPRIDPSWRYTPARGRAGIDLAARGRRGTEMLQAGMPAETGTPPTGKPLELATEPQQAESA